MREASQSVNGKKGQFPEEELSRLTKLGHIDILVILVPVERATGRAEEEEDDEMSR